MTGVLHLFYAECLVRGYRTGNLSIVYPVARGTGPLRSFIGAIVVLGERVSVVATLGTLCIAAGILVLARAAARGWQVHRSAIAWGAVTGLIIASYTLVDGYAVRTLLLPPDRAALVAEYRRCWKEALGISILTPAGYAVVSVAP